MIPAELITRKLRERIIKSGADIPVYSLLLAALKGERQETPSSGIAVNVHIAEQNGETLPHYVFTAVVILTVSIDDDREGIVFAGNYEAIWNSLDFLARGDNCVELGDENDSVEKHVFAVDGFQLSGGDDPDFQEDENGGSFTTSFEATITGRSN